MFIVYNSNIITVDKFDNKNKERNDKCHIK